MRASVLVLSLAVGFTTACTSSKSKGTQDAAPPPPPATACKTDQDCQLYSSYCDGCECIALGPMEADPVCKRKTVNCLRDPCVDKNVVCRSGKCLIEGPPSK